MSDDRSYKTRIADFIYRDPVVFGAISILSILLLFLACLDIRVFFGVFLIFAVAVTFSLVWGFVMRLIENWVEKHRTKK